MKLESLFSLQGRTALVTGGSSGIGEAMAVALGLAGAKVVLMARRAEALEQAAAKLREQGVVVNCLSCDLADVHAAQTGAANALDGIQRRRASLTPRDPPLCGGGIQSAHHSRISAARR